MNFMKINLEIKNKILILIYKINIYYKKIYLVKKILNIKIILKIFLHNFNNNSPINAQRNKNKTTTLIIR